MRTLVVIFIFCTCSGCVQIGSYHPSTQNIETVNRLGRSQLLYVLDNQGRRSVAQQLVMSSSETSWIDPSSGTRISLSTSEIVDIKTQEHIAGKSSGFGIGFLIGASMGVMAGVTADGESSDRSTAAVLGGMGFGVLGGMLSSMMSRRGKTQYRVVWANPKPMSRRMSGSW